MDFSKFSTKADLVERAASLDPPLDLPMSMTRDEMEEALAAHTVPDAPQTASPSFRTVTIRRSNREPVKLSVNGKNFEIPVGREVTIPASLLPALDDAGIEYE